MINLLRWEPTPPAIHPRPNWRINVVLLYLGDIERTESVLRTNVSQKEQQRAERFTFQADRSRFIAGRFLLRKFLSKYIDREMSDIPIQLDQGRPYVEDSMFSVSQIPQFNISHSGDYVALAWSFSGAIGVDVEQSKELSDLKQIARRVMNDQELEKFSQMTMDQQLDYFYSLWVRKEAVLKKMQAGFSLEPNRIHVGVSRDFLDSKGTNNTTLSMAHYLNHTIFLGHGWCKTKNGVCPWSIACDNEVHVFDIVLESLYI